MPESTACITLRVNDRAGFRRINERVHLKGVYFLTQKLLPLIADGGRIVNTSSGLVRFAILDTRRTPR